MCREPRYLFVGVARNASGAAAVAAAARAKSGDAWRSASAASVAKWLSQGVHTNITAPYVDMCVRRSFPGESVVRRADVISSRRYTNALLLLKNGQNPSVGTIVASMHPAYQFKTWGRDGTFAAMILDAAGFHAEAELYLRWMSTAQVRTV